MELYVRNLWNYYFDDLFLYATPTNAVTSKSNNFQNDIKI